MNISKIVHKPPPDYETEAFLKDISFQIFKIIQMIFKSLYLRLSLFLF